MWTLFSPSVHSVFLRICFCVKISSSSAACARASFQACSNLRPSLVSIGFVSSSTCSACSSFYFAATTPFVFPPLSCIPVSLVWVFLPSFLPLTPPFIDLLLSLAVPDLYSLYIAHLFSSIHVRFFVSLLRFCCCSAGFVSFPSSVM